MTESIVAAAASRIGKTVLHIDSKDYYGGLWASFNFDGIQKWLEEQSNVTSNTGEALGSGDASLRREGERVLAVGPSNLCISNIKEEWHIPEHIETQSSETDPGSSSTTVDINSPKEVDSVHEKVDTENQSIPEPTQTSEVEEACESAAVSTEVETAGEPSGAESMTCETSDGENKENASLDAATQSSSSDVTVEKREEKLWSREDIKKEYRKFNLDLAPKLLYSRGSLVELLISSNIARYAEFRCVTRVLTWLDDHLEPVPCSRADVFSTRHVSVVEKRMLMKLLTVCMDYEQHPQEYEGYESKTFLEFLKSRKLTDNLIHFVLYAISMSKDSTPCLEGLARTQQFLRSLGRYGNTPFLWPMYGAGELPQCFCRLCAVFGGIYYLKRPVESVIFSQEGKSCGLISMDQRLNSSFLVMDMGHAPQQLCPSQSECNGISRGILITNKSVLPVEKEHLTLLQYPPTTSHPNPVTIIEVGASAMACPKDLYVVHMTCKQLTKAEDDLSHAVNGLFRTTEKEEASEHASESQSSLENHKPQILWSLYLNYPDTSSLNLQQKCPDNLFFCSGPDLNMDFEVAVAQAKEIFQQMYPNTDFLPRAPDPEEIVLDDPENDNPGPEFGKEAKQNGSAEGEQEAANKEDTKEDADKEPPKEECEATANAACTDEE